MSESFIESSLRSPDFKNGNHIFFATTMAVLVGIHIIVGKDRIEGRRIRLDQSIYPVVLNIDERLRHRLASLSRPVLLSPRDSDSCDNQY